MLVLCSSCAEKTVPLTEAVASLCDYGVRAVALHRAPSTEEARSLARLKRRPRIAVVYANGGVSGFGRPVFVVEAGARRLLGAAFHPLVLEDLGALREALPATAPAVIECGPADVAEAVRCARSVFLA